MISKGHVAARSAEDNPARRAAIAESASEPKPTACPSQEQVQAILDSLKESGLLLERAATGLVALGGCRPHESRARWEDFDCKESALCVFKSLWHTVEDATKTRRSNGLVPVSPLLDEILMELWRSQGSPISGRILARPDGRAVNLDNVSKRSIRAALSRCATCGGSEMAEA